MAGLHPIPPYNQQTPAAPAPASCDRHEIPTAGRLPLRTVTSHPGCRASLAGAGTNRLQSLRHRPYQVIRCGCPIHAAPATWLGHSRRIKRPAMTVTLPEKATWLRRQRGGVATVRPSDPRTRSVIMDYADAVTAFFVPRE